MLFVPISLFLTSLVVLTHCNAMFDVQPQNRAISGDYTPRGKMVNIGNLSVYEAPISGNSKRMLINGYDIYGLSSSNLKQVTDLIALQNGGFRAILPDFFRGEFWDASADRSKYDDWYLRVADWPVVKPDLINLLRHYRSEGVEEFAIFGFCWGGKVAILAAIEMSDDFKASGAVHPSRVINDEAVDVKIPMFLMPTLDEPDMLPFYRVLLEKFGDNSGHRLFEDVAHGFASATGNFSDPLIQGRVNEVITTLGMFFNRNLNGTIGSNSNNIRPGRLIIMTLISFVFVTLRYVKCNIK